ncbi:hypothetical protein LP420_03140 [Massilia sp. B-10]|nr:hypothetical protein LP420_03140 [Massilia sp. B-10]
MPAASSDGIVAATPSIADKFRQINPRTVDVNNYPLASEFDGGAAWEGKRREVCYVGSIAAVRGIRELVRAFALMRSGARLSLAGQFSSSAWKRKCAPTMAGTRCAAWATRTCSRVRAVMARAMALAS